MNKRAGNAGRILVVIGILATWLVASAPPASAGNNGEWSVSPASATEGATRDWFEFQLRPGQTIRDVVAISNLSDRPMSFAIYPSDAYNTPLDGAFALRLKDDQMVDAGSWLSLGYQTLDVPPRSKAELPFELRVPIDAPPGDHGAGLIAEDLTPPDPVTAQQGVNVQRRVGTRVYIRVDGPLQPQLTVTQLAVEKTQALLPPFTGRGHATIAYEIKNTGNVRLGAQATLRIKGLFGRTLKTYEPAEVPELLPNGSVVFSAELDSLPVVDRLTAEVTVISPSGASTVRSTVFWDVPWLEVVILLVLLALGLLWRRRRRRRAGRLPSDLTPPRHAAEKELALR